MRPMRDKSDHSYGILKSWWSQVDVTTKAECYEIDRDLNLAPSIPLSRMVDEFSMESKPYAMETVDFEEAKRLLREFRDVTSNRKSWLELQALLGRLP